MMTKQKRGPAVVAIACLLAISTSGAGDKWLHVRVEETGHRDETVSVNVPLSVVERMLPLISVDELRHGKLDLGEVDDDLGDLDLAELASALRDSPDANFVTVEREDETVHVAKEGDFLVVRAEEQGRGGTEQVRVRLPLSVFEALVGDDPHELDLVEALRELSKYDGDPLVDVTSDDTSVLIWIDSTETGRR